MIFQKGRLLFKPVEIMMPRYSNIDFVLTKSWGDISVRSFSFVMYNYNGEVLGKWGESRGI